LAAFVSTTDVLPALQRMFTGTTPTERENAFSDWPNVAYNDDDPNNPKVIITDRRDLDIAIGRWTLRLVPEDTSTGGSRFVIDVALDSSGMPTRLSAELARFELIADPADLVAADLHTEPYTHLVATESTSGDPIPVRLLGPGVTLVLSGTGLSNFGIEVTGASGSTDPAFPSLRFDPPHFLIGDGTLGVVCDEAVLDLSGSDNPTPIDELVTTDVSWRGLFLKDLGVFVNSEGAPDTWSGMAALHDFAIGFDGIDLTGTFVGELVHHVVNNPQVVVEIWRMGDDGNAVLASDSGDATVPAPTGTALDYRRVRLVAKPSWDDEDGVRAAGVRVRWTTPNGVTVEEPLRRTSLDLGWVQCPPGNHAFTVDVSDHRITVPAQTRNVTVGAPTGASSMGLVATFDAGLIDPAATVTSLPTHRLHVPVAVGQQVRLTGRVRGGSGTANATLTLPAGYTLVTGAATQQVVRATGSNDYPLAVWVVQAPATMPTTAAEGAFELTVTDTTPTTVRRRVRWSLTTAAAPLQPDFSLHPFTDWLATDGPGITRVELTGGLAFRDIAWSLESVAVTDAVFSDVASDALFTEATSAFGSGMSTALSLSAGTVRPYLDRAGRLWRLTGEVGSGGTPATPAPVVVGDTPGSPRLRSADVTLIPAGTQASLYDDPHATDERPILFAYDSAVVQGSRPGGDQVGPENFPRPLSEVLADQARGLRTLLRALHAYGPRVQAVGLYGAASAEGDVGYNRDLGRRRAESTRTALLAVLAGTAPGAVTTALSNAGWTAPGDLAARCGHLSATNVSVASVGEDGADTTGPDGVEPGDRRVFAVLVLSARTPPAVRHRAYFVTLPGAPPPAVAPQVPERPLQQHPFQHAMFRLAHVEVELRRNRLVRAQIRLTVDLERFDENDALDTTELNVDDGVTTFFLEYRETTVPGGASRWQWELAVLADPQDLDGLALIRDATTAATMGGPAITVPALTALSGGRIGLSAFLAAAAVGGMLTGSGIFTIDTIVWSGIRGRVAHGGGADTELRIGIDYTVKYDVDADLTSMGLPFRLQTNEPLTITFRNLGVVLRDWQHVEFDYDPASGFALEVNDPGVFQLGEGIGRLLAVRSFRSGAGSPLWVEVDLAIALETGIFSIDTLRLRLSIDTDKLFQRDGSGRIRLGVEDLSLSDFDLALNKLGIAAKVPGVLEGRGSAGIRQATLLPANITGTEVAGDVDLSLVPLQLRLYAGFKVFHSPQLTAVYAALGAEFAPGIPLGNTGVALYGLEGLVGVNMRRSEQDPMKVLDWYNANPRGVTHTDKWTPEPGAWAFGVGAVLGTADTGFTWSTKGGLVVSAPGPQILLATYSKFVTPKPGVLPVPTETGISTVVLLDFEHDLLLAAALFELQAGDVLSLSVPAEIFFNLANVRDWHLRLGQWTPEHKRARARVLGMFDAWAYVQFEGNGYTGPGITLDGICIAHGAGISVVFGSRAARVYAEGAIEYHLGLEPRPFPPPVPPFYMQGNLHAQGELHLGPISLGVTFDLAAKAPVPFMLSGEACASVKIWFVRIKGCVGFSIGDDGASTPPPPNPLTGVVPVDAMTSSKVPAGQPVPVDAALHLTFDKVVRDARPAGERALDLGSPTAWRNQVSDDLFYEYDVTSLTLTNTTTGAVLTGWKSAWAQPSLEDASAAQADQPRALRLLDWKPNAHDRALDFEAGYGSTVRNQINRLCEPVPPPRRGCVSFDEEPYGTASSWVLERGEIAPVHVIAGVGEVLAGDLAGQSLGATSAAVVPLPPVSYNEQVPKERALRLPSRGEHEYGGKLGDVFPTLSSSKVWDYTTHNLQHMGITAYRPAQPGDDEPAEWTSPVPVADRDRAEVLAKSGIPLLDGRLAINPALAASARASRQGLLALAGLLFVRLPDLVECETVFLLSGEAAGSAAFLDEDLNLIGSEQEFRYAATVASSTTPTGVWSTYAARAVRMPPQTPGAEPTRAAWLVVSGPERTAWKSETPYERSGYLTQICGTTYAEWLLAQQVAEQRATAVTTITQLSGLIAGIPATSAAPLLARGSTYRLTGSIAWRRYRSSSSAAVDGSGTYPIDFTFSTAGSAPIDIRRYVAAVDPATPAQPHYCAEPVTVWFATDTVDKIFKAYDKQLVARLKADTGAHSLNQPLREGATRQFVPLDSFAQAFSAAIDGADCIGATGAPLFPSMLYATDQPLARNTGYTVALLPRPLTDPPSSKPAGAPAHLSVAQWWDGQLQADFDDGDAVLRADLRSSRWKDFGEHLQAYRDGAVLDLIGDSAAALTAALAATASARRADASIDALCRALFGGPLAIPADCQVLRVWTSNPVATGTPPSFTFAGVLLDGPEPLLRQRRDGSDASTFTLLAGGTAVSATQVASTGGARVFAFCSAPSAGSLTARLAYARTAGSSPIVQDITIPVPAGPGPAD
jgi:hypothetical protein